MKTIQALSMITAILISTHAYSQSDTVGWGRNSRFNMMYNSKTVTEVNGEIVKIESVTPFRGMSRGVHLTMKDGNKNYSVHLGPQWFLDNQSMKLNIKDRVKVTGSLITFEGSPAIIASELTKGDDVLKLRDENGIPVWSRRRR